MTTDSFFALFCAAIIGLFFGFVMTALGYRVFLFLIPVWGFFFGFGLGAQTIQAIFGTGFLSDVTSWVVGFIVAVIFAVLSYLFYFAAVALIAGSLGYAAGTGIMLAITPNLNFIAWLVGIIAAIVLAVVVLRFNVQKYVIILATSLLGAAVIVGTFLFMFGGLPTADLVTNPVAAVLRTSPLWFIIYVVIAALGVFLQLQTSRRYTVTEYNRWEEYSTPAPAP